MKHLLFFVLLLITVPFGLRAQTMVMTPDSATQLENISVTIVGMGTHFEETLGVSNFTAELERSGNNYAQIRSTNMPNDSTITGTLQIPTTMSGYYDLVVWVYDSTGHTFTQDSAFYVKAGSASITSISPSSAYDSQTVYVHITGANTNFQNGTAPTIYFMQNGSIVFTALADSIYSSTSLGAYVSVPSPPTGYYDVIVQNNVYSDTGKALFKVLGPMPTVSLVPDSGMVSSTFEVSIVGQGTDFAPNGGLSVPLNLNLKQGGVTYYRTLADSVISNTLGYATITLSDSISPGMYDAEIYGEGQNGQQYDLYTTFLVTSHHTTIRTQFHYSAKPADTVTVHVSGSGVNFIYGSQYAKSVSLVNGTLSITGQNVTVINDTSLSALFTIPPGAGAGFYSVEVIEPGTGRTDTGQNVFTVTGTYIDTSCTMSPDTGALGQNLAGCLFGVPGTIDSMYLKQGSSIIPVVEQLRLPPCFPIGITVPSTASVGQYDLYIVLGGDGLGDTAVVKNAFTVEAPAGVSDAPIFADIVENIHVSPNPAQDIASISFIMNAPSYVRLTLCDALGRTVATLCERTLGAGTQSFDCAAHDMPAGNYFYELAAGENIYVGRIVVQH